MQAVLERTARRAPVPPPVDTVELPFLTEATELGAVLFNKPFKLEELRTVVRGLISETRK